MACRLATAALLTTRVLLAGEPGAVEPQPPSADTLARPSSVALSLERVLALGPYAEDGESGSSGASIGAGGYLRSFDGSARDPFLPHAAPRLGLDLVLPEAFTLGLAGGFGLSASETSSAYDASKTTTHTQKTAVFAARVGFVAPVSPDTGFWPKVGIAHAWGWGAEPDAGYSSATRTTASRAWSLTIDLPFAFMLTPNLALLLDFSGDLGLAGTSHVTRQDLAGSTTSDGGEQRRVRDGFAISFGALASIP